jgi:tripartite-type tricarboxylate transporter receptor subunit TctC
LFIALTAAVTTADAQPWPARPIRVFVSQAAGGTPDIICRLVTGRMSRALGQQIVVDNRPGSGNIIGAQAAARATPDGYNFFCATAAPLVSNPYTFKKLPYDPVKDFAAVGMIAKISFIVLAHPSVRARTLPELIALEKAQPGKLAFATDGPRNFSGMIAAWLNKLAGTNILQVPYAVMPVGIQDTLAGRTQLAILAVPSAAPFMKRGELRALAVTSARRIPGFEEIPPVAETFPGFDFIGWFALVAPAGTPPAVVKRVNAELDAALKDPDILQRLRDIGFYTDGAETPRALDDFLRAERERWSRVAREIGIEPE